MFNNVAIDVFIGLIAVFLLYSLLASILMETLAKYLALRARITLLAIFKILDDSNFSSKNVFTRFLNSFSLQTFFNNLKSRQLTALFYAHPNIKNLGKNDLYRKPSSISPELFSDTLIQILRGDDYNGQQNQVNVIKVNLNIGEKKTEGKLKLPQWYTQEHNKYKTLGVTDDSIEVNAETIYQLKQMLYDSNSDVDVFKKKITALYNEMMERATGWYTKQTRLLLFIIGFGIALAFNVDTLQLVQKLSTDKTARDKMVEFASKMQNDPALKATIGDLTKKESDAAMFDAFKKVNTSLSDTNAIVSPQNRWKNVMPADRGSHFLGWLITALAISLGAPFWFDLLGKIMAIKQAGQSKKDDASSNSATSSTNSPTPIG